MFTKSGDVEGKPEIVVMAFNLMRGGEANSGSSITQNDGIGPGSVNGYGGRRPATIEERPGISS